VAPARESIGFPENSVQLHKNKKQRQASPAGTRIAWAACGTSWRTFSGRVCLAPDTRLFFRGQNGLRFPFFPPWERPAAGKPQRGSETMLRCVSWCARSLDIHIWHQCDKDVLFFSRQKRIAGRDTENSREAKQFICQHEQAGTRESAHSCHGGGPHTKCERAPLDSQACC